VTIGLNRSVREIASASGYFKPDRKVERSLPWIRGKDHLGDLDMILHGYYQGDLATAVKLARSSEDGKPIDLRLETSIRFAICVILPQCDSAFNNIGR